MSRILITTVPFGAHDPRPLELLLAAGAEFALNPLGRKLSESDLAGMVGDCEVLVAGTEPITDRVMANAPQLRLISRVGIGLDSVDLLAARRRGIQVSYTPDAPAPAVAELTVGLILCLLRQVHTANTRMHRGEWGRAFGRRVTEVTFGIVGVGRIGQRVARHLRALGAGRLLANDLVPDPALSTELDMDWVDKDTLYRESDVVTLHVPLTGLTRSLLSRQELLTMRRDALLVNTARGGVVDEAALYDILRAGHLGGAAMDVFEEEPYCGDLSSLEQCLLTAHMGSMSVDCRARMEVEATEEAIRHLRGEPLLGLIPEAEYQIREQEQ